MAGHAKPSLRPLSGADFRRELENESLRATRGRCPLSLVIFAPKFQDARGKEANALEFLRCVEAQTSPCDSLGLLPEMRYALVLPGAGVFSAQNIASGILQLFAHSGNTCTAGIASADLPENACAGSLLQQAVAALRQNRAEEGAISVYREQAEKPSLHKTLVHSHEKRFLFSGGE